MSRPEERAAGPDGMQYSGGRLTRAQARTRSRLGDHGVIGDDENIARRDIAVELDSRLHLRADRRQDGAEDPAELEAPRLQAEVASHRAVQVGECGEGLQRNVSAHQRCVHVLQRGSARLLAAARLAFGFKAARI